MNSAALWLLHMNVLQLHYLVAAALATQVSTLWNFVLTDRVVFRRTRSDGGWGRMWRFFLMNNLALLLRLPLLALLVNAGPRRAVGQPGDAGGAVRRALRDQ